MKISVSGEYYSPCGDIAFPVFKFADGSYFCTFYSLNRNCYTANVFTVDDFINNGFYEVAIIEQDGFAEFMTKDGKIIRYKPKTVPNNYEVKNYESYKRWQ